MKIIVLKQHVSFFTFVSKSFYFVEKIGFKRMFRFYLFSFFNETFKHPLPGFKTLVGHQNPIHHPIGNTRKLGKVFRCT